MSLQCVRSLTVFSFSVSEFIHCMAEGRKVCKKSRSTCISGKWVLAMLTGCVWMGISSGLIILNKHLMSTDGFHFPMALSALGMIFSSVASYICCRVKPRLLVINPTDSEFPCPLPFGFPA